MTPAQREEVEAWRVTLNRLSNYAATFASPDLRRDLRAVLDRLAVLEAPFSQAMAAGPIADFLAGRMQSLTMTWQPGFERVEWGFTPADPIALAGAA